MWVVAPLLVALPTYFYLRALRSLDQFEKQPARYVAAFVWVSAGGVA